MSHARTVSQESVSSISSILSCSSETFYNLYNDENVATHTLCQAALNDIIEPERQQLQDVMAKGNKRFRLDELLIGMLEHAPHPDGRRYVAVALHIAHGKGLQAVIEVAQAWLDSLFFPMMTIPLTRSDPTGSLTPTIQTTYLEIENAKRDQNTLRNDVANREHHHCAITQIHDTKRRAELTKTHPNLVPAAPHALMHAAHIIPFALYSFQDKGDRRLDAAHTWDMLQAWTQLDIRNLSGSQINSPSNAIFMTTTEQDNFGKFQFYLDKDVYPVDDNKYRAKFVRQGLCFSNGQVEADVQFPPYAQSGVLPPNPEFIRIHAAFAKVLHLSAATEYIYDYDGSNEGEVDQRLAQEADFGELLISKLEIMAH
ncbi:hypothetical protein HGRIS_006617 [Hohenbuehelia grisea]|uniref:HNH nuclease domain-containing protein n=1 Tax=Hohenbuehelia grisea TaxID=104357 RepID=A0ABR3JA24_9AGAR